MEQVFSVSCDSDRLNLPSVLVLNSCGITCAGDEREIAAFCAHVSELDLSDNKLEDWHEVQAARCCAGERRWVPLCSCCAPLHTLTLALIGASLVLCVCQDKQVANSLQ